MGHCPGTLKRTGNMPRLRIYRLFISHAWRHHEEYDRLVDLLNRAPYFHWQNYSSPEHDPVVDPDTRVGKRILEQALRNQIRPVHCVLVLAGMYAAHSDWIQRELDLAREMGKPIIGVKPRGRERMPRVVADAADEIVGWRTDSILQAIRRWAR